MKRDLYNSNFKPTIITLCFGILIGSIFTLIFLNLERPGQKSLIQASLFDGLSLFNSAAPALPVCGLTKMPASDNSKGIIQSESEYAAATNTFKTSHPQNPLDSVTWGGMIGKDYLMAIINSLGSENIVKFRFATDNGMHKTCVYFQGGNSDPVTGGPAPGRLYIRTGIAPDSFCPINCD